MFFQCLCVYCVSLCIHVHFQLTTTYTVSRTNVCLFICDDSVVSSVLIRNGVLIDHHLTEVNGQNVIGLKDKQIAEIFGESPRTITITIMPNFVYDHLMKK